MTYIKTPVRADYRLFGDIVEPILLDAMEVAVVSRYLTPKEALTSPEINELVRVINAHDALVAALIDADHCGIAHAEDCGVTLDGPCTCFQETATKNIKIALAFAEGE